MRFCIVVSEIDPASVNIKESLLKHYSFIQRDRFLEHGNISMLTMPMDSIECEDIDHGIDADFFIFPARHESKKGTPSLCVHAPGNWGEADYGGKKGMLCIAPACLMKTALLELHKRAAGTRFDVMPEATHHGPFLGKPCMFIEIGSRVEEWKDPEAGGIVADTIVTTVEKGIVKSKTALGIGGLHHAPKFSRLILSESIAFGHICPKYNLENLSEEMLMQAIERTYENVDHVYLDWKGLGQEKSRILELLKNLHIEYIKVK